MIKFLSAVVAIGVGLASQPAAAHEFGDRYDLPLPLTFFLTGAAAVVALSFVIMGVFLRHTGSPGDYPRYDLRRMSVFGWLTHPRFLQALRLIAVAVFLLTIATGLFGGENPARNFSIVMVWIVAWVGLAFVFKRLLPAHCFH